MSMPEWPPLPGAARPPAEETIDPSHFYQAFVFNQPEAQRTAITMLIGQAQQFGYPVRYWWLSETVELEGKSDQLLVGVHQPPTGMDGDLVEALHRQTETLNQPVGWVGLETSAIEAYSEFGKVVTQPESICWPDGLSLFPKPDMEWSLAAALNRVVDDIQTAAKTKLGRDLNADELEAVLNHIRTAPDWPTYLEECVQTCRGSEPVGAPASG